MKFEGIRARGKMNVAEIIERAKKIHPIGVYYKGRITEEEMTELEKECDVQCSSVYMNGEGEYRIRYRQDK